MVVTEVLLAVMMIICVMTACLWTNCGKKNDLLRGRQYTGPISGSTYQL